MRNCLVFLLIVFSSAANAQVPHPAILSLKGIWGDSGEMVSPYLTKTYDGGFVICIQAGSSPGSGNIDSFCSLSGDRNIFMKYNADATVLEWTKCIQQNGDSSINFLFPTSDGGVVLAGDLGGDGAYISKHDALDNIVWSRKYGVGFGVVPGEAISTSDGGYILVCGAFYIDANFTVHHGSWMNADIGLLKLDSAGNKMWSTVIGGSGDDNCSKIVEGPDSGYYLVGTTPSDDYDCTGNHGDSTGSRDVYLARLDKTGHIIWHRDIGGQGDDFGSYGVADGKGGIIVGASCGSYDGDVTHKVNYHGTNMWALDVDSSGNIVWQNCYGGGGSEYNNAICKAADGTIWLAGANLSGDHAGVEVDTCYGRDDAWFVHADSVGNYLSSVVFGSSDDDQSTIIYPLSNGAVLAGGYYDSNTGTFASLGFYGHLDYGAFLTVFAKWPEYVTPLKEIADEIRMCPNPATEYVDIQSKPGVIISFVIIDVFGRVIYEGNMNGSAHILLDNWRKGVYFIHFMGEQGLNQMNKLIVE